MKTREWIREMIGRIEQMLEGSVPCYDSHLHGRSHLREVVMLTGHIAAESGGDVEASVISGLLHDCGRLDDGGSNYHAIDSARLARPVTPRPVMRGSRTQGSSRAIPREPNNKEQP